MRKTRRTWKKKLKGNQDALDRKLNCQQPLVASFLFKLTLIARGCIPYFNCGATNSLRSFFVRAIDTPLTFEFEKIDI
jgi:hypothetical protein